MLKTQVRIVSERGTGLGTRVFLPDGSELENVTSITIKGLEAADELVTAQITVVVPALDIVAMAEIEEVAR